MPACYAKSFIDSYPWLLARLGLLGTLRPYLWRMRPWLASVKASASSNASAMPKSPSAARTLCPITDGMNQESTDSRLSEMALVEEQVLGMQLLQLGHSNIPTLIE